MPLSLVSQKFPSDKFVNLRFLLIEASFYFFCRLSQLRSQGCNVVIDVVVFLWFKAQVAKSIACSRDKGSSTPIRLTVPKSRWPASGDSGRLSINNLLTPQSRSLHAPPRSSSRLSIRDKRRYDFVLWFVLSLLLIKFRPSPSMFWPPFLPLVSVSSLLSFGLLSLPFSRFRPPLSQLLGLVSPSFAQSVIALFL